MVIMTDGVHLSASVRLFCGESVEHPAPRRLFLVSFFNNNPSIIDNTSSTSNLKKTKREKEHGPTLSPHTNAVFREKKELQKTAEKGFRMGSLRGLPPNSETRCCQGETKRHEIWKLLVQTWCGGFIGVTATAAFSEPEFFTYLFM